MQPKATIPLNWPTALWMAFMAAASLALTLGFACAAPLAAFGAASALTLSRRNAVLATLGAWFANQAAGCTVLGYPLTAEMFAWGAVFGLGATLAVFAARWAGSRAATLFSAAAPVAAFAAAFATYQAVLFAASLAFMGGTEEFTITVIGRVLAIDTIAMLTLLLLNRAAAPFSHKREPVPAAYKG